VCARLTFTDADCHWQKKIEATSDKTGVEDELAAVKGYQAKLENEFG